MSRKRKPVSQSSKTSKKEKKEKEESRPGWVEMHFRILKQLTCATKAQQKEEKGKPKMEETGTDQVKQGKNVSAERGKEAEETKHDQTTRMQEIMLRGACALFQGTLGPNLEKFCPTFPEASNSLQTFTPSSLEETVLNLGFWAARVSLFGKSEFLDSVYQSLLQALSLEDQRDRLDHLDHLDQGTGSGWIESSAPVKDPLSYYNCFC